MNQRMRSCCASASTRKESTDGAGRVRPCARAPPSAACAGRWRGEILSRLRPVAKEPWTVRWLERSLRDGDVLYDVGANVGAYSLIAAALGAQVVAIEPAYANYAA